MKISNGIALFFAGILVGAHAVKLKDKPAQEEKVKVPDVSLLEIIEKVKASGMDVTPISKCRECQEEMCTFEHYRECGKDKKLFVPKEEK